jgi:hypothetical protein
MRCPMENGVKLNFKDVVWDEINFEKREIFFTNNLESTNQERVFYSVTTNGYTKILRFDNNPPLLIRDKAQEESSIIVSNSSGPD